MKTQNFVETNNGDIEFKSFFKINYSTSRRKQLICFIRLKQSELKNIIIPLICF